MLPLDGGPPFNQLGFSSERAGTCLDPMWTNGGASTLRVAGTAGAGTATSPRSKNRFAFEIPKKNRGITLHASENLHAGPDGFTTLGDINRRVSTHAASYRLSRVGSSNVSEK